jgi:endonuclease G
MAVKKNAKKKTAARKRAPKRAPARKKSARVGTAWKSRRLFVCAVLLLAIAATVATYWFGSFALRSKMERVAIHSINFVRAPEAMPRPIVSLLNIAYDAIPESRGLVVEGGELGHDGSALIAGVPLSKEPIRILHNTSYINLFNERERQSRGVALLIGGKKRHATKIPDSFFEDPRIKQLRASDMLLGEWAPHTIAPAELLTAEYGPDGANEACLVTNLTPMTANFADGLWARLMQELASYPKRFGETWIYLGPVMRRESTKLSSGIPVPDGFYAIAFDLTDTGGLRAIAFLIPQNGEHKALRHYISSIARIEELTGLKFLPKVDYHAQEVLRVSVSPQLW